MSRRPRPVVVADAATNSPAPTSPPAAVTNAVHPANDAALLHRIADATRANGSLYLPEDVANSLRELMYIETDPSTRDQHGNVLARGTSDLFDKIASLPGGSALPAQAQAQPQGTAAWGTPPAPAASAAPSNDATQWEIDEDVEIPTIRRGGGAGRKSEIESQYPFKSLAKVGASFHVPFAGATDDKNHPAKTLSSTVSNYNRRFAFQRKDANGIPMTEQKMLALRDENGDIRKDAQGNALKAMQIVPVYDYTQQYAVRRVGAEDKRGPGARVFRVK